MSKKIAILYGLIPGLIIPMILAILLYRFWNIGAWSEFYYRSTMSGNLSKMLALGCFGNLALFFLYIKLEKLQAAQGVIYGTMFYVLVSVYYLFIR